MTGAAHATPVSDVLHPMPPRGLERTRCTGMAEAGQRGSHPSRARSRIAGLSQPARRTTREGQQKCSPVAFLGWCRPSRHHDLERRRQHFGRDRRPADVLPVRPHGAFRVRLQRDLPPAPVVEPRVRTIEARKCSASAPTCARSRLKRTTSSMPSVMLKFLSIVRPLPDMPELTM
jgi:hypothetical protein